MVRNIEAVFEAGLLRPLEQLNLTERQRVQISIEDSVGQNEEPNTLANERRAEMEWFSAQSAKYPGQWLAIEGDSLRAHGPRLADVRKSARAAGAVDPLYARVPSNSAPFAGW